MVYRFAVFELDMDRFELRKNGAPVAVEPQVLSLLALLVTNRQRMVPKGEIHERIWSGRVVSEAALSSRIRSVRKAIGDDGGAQRLIRTVHGKGFRFVGEVSDATGAVTSPGPARAWRVRQRDRRKQNRNRFEPRASRGPLRTR